MISGQTCLIRCQKRKQTWQKSWLNKGPKVLKVFLLLPRWDTQTHKSTSYLFCVSTVYLSIQLFNFQICSSKLMNLSLMSMRSKTLSLQQTFLVNYKYYFIHSKDYEKKENLKDFSAEYTCCVDKVMMRRRTLISLKAQDLVQWQICSWRKNQYQFQKPLHSLYLDHKISTTMVIVG